MALVVFENDLSETENLIALDGTTNEAGEEELKRKKFGFEKVNVLDACMAREKCGDKTRLQNFDRKKKQTNSTWRARAKTIYTNK